MRSNILFIVALILTALSVIAQDTTMDLEETLAIFRDGRLIVEYSDHGRAQLEAAIETFKNALGIPGNLNENSEKDVNAFAIDQDQKDLVNKLSQCYFTLGAMFMKGKDNQEDIHRKGKHWGLKSLRMTPDFVALEKGEGFVEAIKVETDVAALYWACMNWLGVAKFDKLAAIPAGIVRKTITMLERILELDETYDCYGPYRVLGSIWGALPRMPFGAYRKNLERARTYLCQVVDSAKICSDPHLCLIDPACTEYFGNRRTFTEFYLMEKGLWEDAAQVLQSVIDEPIGEIYPLCNARAQDDARELLDEVNKHL
jgi:tetratricopeptide (TPR) repeat protein